MLISETLISSEKKTLGRPSRMEQAQAKSRARVDLLMAGRAATTTSWPGCRPWVSRSRSLKPVEMPVSRPSQLDRLEQLVHQLTKGYTPTGNARVDGHLETLLDILKTSSA
jgi:hypothetical protein